MKAMRWVDASRRMLARSDELMLRGWQGHTRNHQMMERGCPVCTQWAAGCRFCDVDGNEYIDLFAGIAVNSLGHGHARLAQAVADQAARLIHVSNIYGIPGQIERAENVARSVETALDLALEGTISHGRLWNALVCAFGDEAGFWERHAAADQASVISFLAFDPANANSIASCGRSGCLIRC